MCPGVYVGLWVCHLRCDVIWRPTEGGGGDSIEDPLLAHPEVRQLTVTLRVQQYVVQLQVSAGAEGSHT